MSVDALMVLVECPEAHELQLLAGMLEELGIVYQWASVDDALVKARQSGGLLIQDATQAQDQHFALPRALARKSDSQLELLLVAGPDIEVRRRGVAAGVQDFIDLPLDAAMVSARLKTYLHHVQVRDRTIGLQREVESYRYHLAQERQVALSMFDTLLHSENLEAQPNLRWSLDSNALFNGHLILAAPGPRGNQHLLVGSFPGQGLAASVGSLPTAEIFYTMTAKGFDLLDMVEEMHRRLTKLLPANSFFSVCLVDVDTDGQTLHLWNGGLPDGLLVRNRAEMVERIPSRHMPLAITREGGVGREIDLLSLEPGDRLLLSSNEIWESSGLPGPDQNEIPLADCLWANAAENAFDCLLNQIEEVRQTDEAGGHIALLEYCAKEGPSQAVPSQGRLGQGTGFSLDWQYELRLDAEALRGFDPRPMLTQMLVDIQGLEEHRERLYTTIAELFSNALEHGVLGLDSRLKLTPEGFASYYTERERLLSELDGGLVRFHLRHQPLSDGGRLLIEVWDSGAGFNIHTQGGGQLPETGYSGRGIGLIRQMCEEVQYFEPGNHVRVSYRWTRMV